MALPFVILIFKLINCSVGSSTWFFGWSMFWNFEKKIRTCASLNSFAMFVQQARRSKATRAIQSVNVFDWKVSFTKSSRRIRVCRRETKIDLLLLFVRNVLNYSALVWDLGSVRWEKDDRKEKRQREERESKTESGCWEGIFLIILFWLGREEREREETEKR